MAAPTTSTAILSMQRQGHDSTAPGLRCQPERIPVELQAGPWVNFRVKPKPNGKWDKIPTKPAGLTAAKVTDPDTFGTFAQAQANLDRPGVAGLSRIMTDTDDVVGFDWDDCVSDAGEISPEVLAEIAELGCYAELSWSGHGVRGFGRGRLPVDGRKAGQRECYQALRHLTVTGHHIAGTPTALHPNQAALDAWYLRHFGPPPTPRPRIAPNPATALDDQVIISKARAAANSAKFGTLFDQLPSTPDLRASEDDLALADMLAFYTQDPAQLRRLLEASARRRDKWDTRRGASTWLDVYVIDKALSQGGPTYSGGRGWETSPPPAGAVPAAELDGSPAIMAELARVQAELAAERARRAQAEGLNSAILRALANSYLRNEVRLIVAEAMDYAKALRRDALDSDGFCWLYIGTKKETGLAGQAQMSPRTISRQLHRHTHYEIAGQPLVRLLEDEVEGSDGQHRTRYRYKVPFLEQGGTLVELVAKIADYEPPGVADGTRDKPGGDPHARAGHCEDCGGALEQETEYYRRVQDIEKSRVKCRGCGTVTDEIERVTKTETHVRRAPRITRLDLPDLPRAQPAGVAPTSAIMAEVPSGPPLPPTVEDEVRATPCPVPADSGGPSLPPGMTHWCDGDHQFPVPLPPKVDRCSGCLRTWRSPDEEVSP